LQYAENIMSSLEKFDTPIIIINQVFEGEDWGVVTSYISKQDVAEVETEESLPDIGWHVSITLPNLDDVDLTQVFCTPEAALEYGISQILNGNLKPVSLSVKKEQKDDDFPFGHYHSVA